MEWYWINLSYACYGIAVTRGIVTQAAPIAKWMINKPFAYCQSWLTTKGATIIKLPA